MPLRSPRWLASASIAPVEQQLRYNFRLLLSDGRYHPIMIKAASLLAALVVVVFIFFKRARPQKAQVEGPISSWIIPDRWSVGRGDREGKPIITRFNKGLQTVVGHPSFKKQIGIAVPFTHPTEDGLPGSEERAQLSDLEDEIRQQFSIGNESLFAGVITTGGMREFVLYTSNEPGAVAKAQLLARDTKHHVVQYIVNDDPEWNVFKTFAPQ
jgi:hypothetical protein